MALMACWECEREVSDSATSCPHCGAAFAQPPPSRKRFYFYSTLLFLVVFVTFALFGSRDTRGDWEAEAIRAGKYNVTMNMKDPESVRFGEVWARKEPTGEPITCGYVNAKNSYGGYGGEKRFISDGPPRIDDGSDNFDQLWRETCR